jgi:hypothetical protein
MSKDLQYRISSDADGKPLDGSKNYWFHLSANMPASPFWSVIVYDAHTQLMIQSGQAWPSIHSNSKRIAINPDKSVDIWFAPLPPEGMENNWLQTLHGKEWYLILRIYDLMESVSNIFWKPDEIGIID